eukprot:CAMPEP_0118819666 /NCGR_PEP_ID=MMETSP1162-20130426/7118_1 /TAXON_ID=33656 /ORGANISM="Phaeocystis Sp, Strain CCMP2710" /LENGTH=165 /DNA_ID=CAMNT_0006749975 /DNA_START=29 /DNA_END=523 /DNA_ORIENTATION=-
MKFEEKLAASMRRSWEEHYIDYKGLKKLIKRIVKQEAAEQEAERRCIEQLEAAARDASPFKPLSGLTQALLPRDSLQRQTMSRNTSELSLYGQASMGGMGAEVDFLTACRAQYHKVQAFYAAELDRSTEQLHLLLAKIEAAAPPPKEGSDGHTNDARERRMPRER